MQTKLRLFKLVMGERQRPVTDELGNVRYWDNKRVAKQERDRLSEEPGVNGSVQICRGPDHDKGETGVPDAE